MLVLFNELWCVLGAFYKSHLLPIENNMTDVELTVPAFQLLKESSLGLTVLTWM